MVSLDVKSYQAFGQEILAEAGQLALRYFRTRLIAENKKKQGFDPVTRADKEVETLIRQRIGQSYPDHGIIGEEFAAVNANSALQWIIDPIDGTRSYMTGMTGWGILLGLIEDQRPTIGFMHQPYLNEIWIGSQEGSRLLRGSQETSLHTSKTTSLADAILYCTHPEMFAKPATLANFEALANATRLMRYGGDCYAYCLLAMGLIDIVVEDNLQPYDILPLMPIIENAGGVVTDLEGRAPLTGGTVITAANEELHKQALAFMRR
jgi:histidinol phosphatase-like enzyme (inositol monophosphatase family)